MYEKGKIAQIGRFFAFYLHMCQKSSTFAPGFKVLSLNKGSIESIYE